MTIEAGNKNPLHHHAGEGVNAGPWTQGTLAAHLQSLHGVDELPVSGYDLDVLIPLHDSLNHGTPAEPAKDRAPAAKRDEYLARLDARIRQVHGQAWNDEAGRAATLGGLVLARGLYAHPDRLRYRFADGLREALDGSLPDEDEPLFPPSLDDPAAHDARLRDGWATWEGHDPAEGRTLHVHAHDPGPLFDHAHSRGHIPHDHEPGSSFIPEAVRSG